MRIKQSKNEKMASFILIGLSEHEFFIRILAKILMKGINLPAYTACLTH